MQHDKRENDAVILIGQQPGEELTTVLKQANTMQQTHWTSAHNGGLRKRPTNGMYQGG